MLKKMLNTTKWSALVTLAALGGLLVVAAAQAQSAGNLALKTAQNYRQEARYPGHSWVLPAESSDPIVDERVPSKLTVTSPDKAISSQLTIWSQQVTFEFPQPVDLYASLSGLDRSLSKGDLTGEIVTQDGRVLGSFSYLDNGWGADETAGDGIYSARVQFLSDLEPNLADAYMVRVRADLGEGQALHGVNGFLYSRPWARLTGNYRENLVDGDLVVSAEIEVSQPGRFHLMGTLHTTVGQPIGVAQAAIELDWGRHWVDLSFFGLMFHDRNVAGPFRLGTLALTTTGGMPNAKSAVVQDALVTKPYGLSQLRSQPFGDPDLMEAANRLEVEAFLSKLGASQ